MWILLLTLPITLVGRPLAAQFPTDVAVGSRVRIVLPDSVRQSWGPPQQQWLRGEVAALSGDTLYLQLQGAASAVPIRRATIKRIDRSLGIPTRPESAIRGALIGALWGAIYTGLLREGTNVLGNDFAEGAAIGGGIGFLLGALFPSERWRRVRLR